MNEFAGIASQLHGMFEALVVEGFSAEHALKITCEVARETVAQSAKQSGGLK